MLKYLILAAALFVTPAYAVEIKTFTGVDAKASCLSSGDIKEREATLLVIAPAEAGVKVVADVSTEEGEGKKVWAAIQEVLKTNIKAGHFEVVLMADKAGRSAMVMYGDEDGQFCNWFSLSPDQVKAVVEILDTNKA